MTECLCNLDVPRGPAEAGGKLLSFFDNPIILGKTRELSDRNAVAGEFVGLDAEFWQWEWWGGLELDRQGSSSGDHCCQHRSSHGNSREVKVGTLYELKQPTKVQNKQLLYLNT
ncbi:hypothetical protein Ahy_B01g054757 isoform C [Arachis hypogaea]|uniref:Uncharacterized protein n=1 Tax=Arachis hypogaea TaxID=3818 RepID=A0A445AUA4_ARAHY|nr:hypothetical protein Ahy_B01g054757 isoform C [Arachis hypogaea]